MPDLRLIAFDGDDLQVLSAHLQDAVLRVADMAYMPRDKRFAAIANRFDWAAAKSAVPARQPAVRRQAGLRFERVLAAKFSGFDPAASKTALALLAVTFTPSASVEGADGDITLMFSGGGAVRLNVECIEAEMKDLGPAWSAARVPSHPEEAD